MLQLDDGPAKPDDVGPVRPQDHLAPLWFDPPFPPDVPGGLALEPGIAIGPGLVRPVPDVDLAALGDHGSPASGAGRPPTRERLDLLGTTKGSK
ncbi:hypothetical protein B7486_76185 [cyanobacterium TDX16]|nr:hypothetical protein B7486_76185 [cyanobacterium TDX16]